MSGLGYYDRQGQPISLERWSELLATGDNYRRVASTDVGPYWVSTVWLGLDHSFGRGRPGGDPVFSEWLGGAPAPVIFETMVFAGGDRDDPEHDGLLEFDMVRYCTEDQARQGHEDMVTLIRATWADSPTEDV